MAEVSSHGGAFLTLLNKSHDFWAQTGHDRFLAVNAFFEHLGLIAGLVLVSIMSLRSQSV